MLAAARRDADAVVILALVSLWATAVFWTGGAAFLVRLTGSVSATVSDAQGDQVLAAACAAIGGARVAIFGARFAGSVSAIGDTVVILTLVPLWAWAVCGAGPTVFESSGAGSISAIDDALT